MTRSASHHRQILWLVAIMFLAFGLRVAYLGFTFVSSDDIELAHRIIQREGYLWMIEEHYGVLISLLVKLHAQLVVTLGIPMTEFWWRLPVALAGTALVPATYLATRWMGLSRPAGLIAAAFMAVLPIHVFHSRYLWGYEVLGALFAVLAVMGLTRFFAQPTVRRGVAAGLLCSVYLVSHGYILPFFGVLLLVPALLADHLQPNPWRRLGTGLQLYFTKGVFVPIVLTAPVYRYAIEHALEKRTRLGFYGTHYAGEILQNIGVFFVVIIVVALLVFAVEWRRSRRPLPTARRDLVVLTLLGTGFGYLLPIFLMTPPGITLTRNYLILGPLFLLLASVAIADRHGLWQRTWALRVAVAVTLLTGWGAFESYYSLDRWIDPAMVTWERGARLPDPGSKALGYLIRTTVPKGANVLYIHRKMEPPNVAYYCGLAHSSRSFYDRSLRRSRSDFARSKDWADFVVADRQQVGFFAGTDFELVHDSPQFLIFGRPGIGLDTSRLPQSLAAANHEFDVLVGPWINRLVDRPYQAGGAPAAPAAPTAPR